MRPAPKGTRVRPTFWWYRRHLPLFTGQVVNEMGPYLGTCWVYWTGAPGALYEDWEDLEPVQPSRPKEER